MADQVRPRQAVVLIHGIGDQVPMATTRGFVNDIRPETRKWRVYSEADQADETFELHTFTALPPEGADPRVPQTDFYEGYWAEEAHGTQLAHVWRWARRVFFTGLLTAPRRLRWIYALAAGLAVLFVAAVVVLLFTPLGQAISVGTPRIAVQVIAPVLLGVASGWLIKSLGDLARYTDDHPDNVDMRQAIRQRLVGLLGELHDDGRYNRIIVIGHSLGGIVAYDALRLLWAKRTGGDTGDFPGQADDHAVAQAAARLTSPYEAIPASSDLKMFCAQQYALYEDLRERRIPIQKAVKGEPRTVDRPSWLVTDLVTLGSPIAYPELLLADGRSGELDALIRERQLPTCPPQEVNGSGSGYRYQPAEGSACLRYHHGAMFAAVRWINVFAHGDFAGGPISRDTLGAGVINKELSGGWPIKSHSRYWKNHESQKIIEHVLDEPEKCHESII